jgi:hypothetical protein
MLSTHGFSNAGFFAPNLLRHGTSVYTVSFTSHSGIRTGDAGINRSLRLRSNYSQVTTAPLNLKIIYCVACLSVSSEALLWKVRKMTQPWPVKGCKIYAYARRSGLSLIREWSLLCHTCCEMGPRFFAVSSIGPPNFNRLLRLSRVWGRLKCILTESSRVPIQWPLTTRKGMRRNYSYPGPHESKKLIIRNDY